MRDESQETGLLSREELEALLAEAEAGRAVRSVSPRLAEPLRRERGAPRSAPPLEPRLAEAIEDVARAWAKGLSSRHQRRISCSVIGWEELTAEELAGRLLQTDRVSSFEVPPSSARGCVAVGRPLLFSLLVLEFGGQQLGDPSVVERDYTRIERRFMRRVAAELLEPLRDRWQRWCPLGLAWSEMLAPDGMVERMPGPILLATLDVVGLGPIGRIRIALPGAAFQLESRRVEQRGGAPELRDTVEEVEVELRVELGSAELSLDALSALRVGDVIPIREATPDGFVVRVEDQPKFRATRGTVGSRLAVQVVERIQEGG